MSDKLRLTAMAKAGGCAAKIGPGVLSGILGELPKFCDPNLIVGFDTSDDAAVYRISDELAMIQTVDFFPPVVDDPFTFGQIAAANALSDIYAMGGIPKTALNLICFPSCLDLCIMKEILEGGYSKVSEAGAVIAGGHTIADPEPKYGLSVTGFLHPSKILKNNTAKVGDVLVLTKPLGVGILSVAARAELLSPEEEKELTGWMTRLNKGARDAVAVVGAHACTDITGFGLLGHSREMAAGGEKSIEFFADSIPILPKALELAKEGLIPAGAYQNMNYLEPMVHAPGISRNLLDCLYDPQTSGGLLVALPEDKAKELIGRIHEAQGFAAMVGQVAPFSGHLLHII